MTPDQETTAPVLNKTKVYSAPRRFDLATLFVVIIVYSCLLGLFVGVGLPDQATFSILGFLTLVAIAQPALFGGEKPRLASVIAGGMALPTIFFLLTRDLIQAPTIEMLTGAVCSFPLGVSLGYIAGTMVGGVFLVADWVRKGRGVVG